MWIVRLALSRPYTFLVLAILLLLLGPLAIYRTPTDIFPSINIPVVSVIWTYNGLPPDEIGERIVGYFERALTTTVNDIEHIESESLLGVGIIKIYFQPTVNVDLALSQVTAIGQTMLKNFPQGTTPPQVLTYNASTVPVLQLVLSSVKLSEQALNDLGNNFLRTQLAVVQGAALPYPYGGKVRQIQVDLDPAAMQTYGISPADVNNAIGAQNLILPAGTEKIADYEYFIKLNSSPDVANELNNMPIKTTNGGVLYIRDVAHVRDGFAPQTNIVRVNGVRAVLMNVQKTGNASTLDIVNQVKSLIPKIKDSMPPELDLSMISDQSLFVKAAIHGVIGEGVLAAILTGLMILLFIGSWRSTLIIVISIPLSILSSLIMLWSLGETINIMTLGGLALAVGILVDDATVTIENINWNLEQGKEVEQAILDGAQQIAIPALVSTLCICIVFLPMFFLRGVAHFLFVPLAEAVIFAMLASYFLSRTLVPTLAKYWLHKQAGPIDHDVKPTQSANFLVRFQQEFSWHFESMRHRYHSLLEKTLKNSRVFVAIFSLFLLISLLVLVPWIGEDFFPSVDAGQLKLHLRAPAGTRVEETAKIADQVDDIIRGVIPAAQLDSIVDNIGLPISGINLSYGNSGTIGPQDADILVSLKPGHSPTPDYVRQLRTKLNQTMPGVSFAFLPADIVSQILNFGLPAPINIQVMGFNLDKNRRYAEMLLEQVKHIPGIVDARTRQSFNYPELFVSVDRSLAQELGFSQYDIASDLLISLSGSFQTSPTFWLSPQGVSYPIVTQTPQYKLDSLEALRNVPISKPGVPTQILGALATIERRGVPAVESHYNVQPVIDIFASVQDRDLGGVGKDIDKLLAKTKKLVPKGSTVIATGQMRTQRDSFNGLFGGLVFAIVLVYLLIVVNFQSWVDPFIIITALPAAITGIAWMLFLTHTTLSVPALTGSIMCMGVAAANSILMVSFALQGIADGKAPTAAALEAGYSRLRPVLMTALAMIIGMLPMSLGLGEGGEQNAPLGRAVIGGLLFATVATLFFVPSVFSIIHERRLAKKKYKKVMPL
jgi:multidrug efflux pump subunit AcrB